MFRRHLLLIAGCAAAALLLGFCYSLSRGRNAPPEPKSLDEVAQTATNLGLHHRSDALSGEVQIRLVISTRPLTFERANSLKLGTPNHPCWQNTVAACSPWHDYLYLVDPDHGVVWGEVFLFGDPALIRTLTAGEPVLLPEKNLEEVGDAG